MPRKGVPIRQKHPELVQRLVNPEDAERAAGYNGPIDVWCDGSVQGNTPHERTEYSQTGYNFTKGQNACPVCGRRGGSARSIAAKRPELVERLVDAEDGATAALGDAMVAVWCNGTVQGNAPHQRSTYPQRAAYLTKGQNACPVCGPMGSAHSLQSRFPELVQRLVNPADASRAAKATTPVELWCDGTVQGNAPHKHVTYAQPMGKFTDGRNGCPQCGRRGAANSLAAKAPELVARLVDPADAALTARNGKRVRVRCDGDGTHTEAIYLQTVNYLVTGQNGCPVCGYYGASRSIAAKHPELVAQLVHPEDAEHAATGNDNIEVWCDGAVRGNPAHPRIDYEQRVTKFTQGLNGCPLCSTGATKHRERLILVLEDFMARDWSHVPQEVLDLIVAAHRIDPESAIGQALRDGDSHKLTQLSEELRTHEATAMELAREVVGDDALDPDELLLDMRSHAPAELPHLNEQMPTISTAFELLPHDVDEATMSAVIALSVQQQWQHLVELT